MEWIVLLALIVALAFAGTSYPPVRRAVWPRHYYRLEIDPETAYTAKTFNDLVHKINRYDARWVKPLVVANCNGKGPTLITAGKSTAILYTIRY